MELPVEDYSTKSTIVQLGASVLANTGMFLSGMVLAFPSAVLGPLVELEILGYDVSINQGSWVASVAALSSPLGCLLGGPLVDKFGRRRGLQLLNIPNIIGWMLLTLVPYPFQSLYPLILGRILTGFGAGLATCAAASYTAEVVTARLRTLLVTLSPVMLGFGVFTVYLMADLFRDQWTLAAGIGSCISIVSIIFTPFLPESPMWLLTKNAPEKARKCLMAMRATKDPQVVEEEFSRLSNHESKQIKASWRSTLQIMGQPQAYKPFIIMNLFFLFQQLSGTTIIIVYGVKFAKDAEIPKDAYTVALFIGIVRVISNFITTWACNKYGRRRPAIVAGAGVTVSLLGLMGYVYMRHEFPYEVPATPLIPAAFILLNILTSSVGYSFLPWSMLGEVFPTSVRGVCSGLTSCIAYIVSFIAIKFYPIVESVVGNTAVFGFFGFSALLGTVFLAIFLPETHGKTLQDIEEYFKGSKKSEKNNLSTSTCNLK